MTGSAPSTATEYEFECPECNERFEVNDSMREALIERGCPVCSGAVSADSFSQVTS